MSFSKHSGVIAAFGQHFAHAGKVPIEFPRHLLEAQNLRLAGDYDPGDAVSNEQAEEQIIQAQQFLDVAQNLISQLP